MVKAAIGVAVVLGACVQPTSYGGPPTSPQYGPPDPNSKRTVELVSALLGPARSNGKIWDGINNRNMRAVIQQFADQIAAATQDPYAVAAAFLVGPVMSGVEPPDAKGRIELYVGGRLASTQKVPRKENTFTPQWLTPVGFINVDIRFARLRIVLVDEDVTNDDPFGTIDIDAEVLLAAANAPNGRYSFNALEQTRGQVAFVDLAVY